MTIKQPNGSGMCTVCVAAMATGSTTDEVYAFLNDNRTHGDPISDFELLVYCLSRGYSVGMSGQFTDEVEWKDIVVTHPKSLEVVYDFSIGPAYVAVKSENYGGVGHAVYWDGEFVRDPNPEKPDVCNLSEYKILSVHPIFKNLHSAQPARRILMSPCAEPPLFVRDYRETGPYESVSRELRRAAEVKP